MELFQGKKLTEKQIAKIARDNVAKGQKEYKMFRDIYYKWVIFSKLLLNFVEDYEGAVKKYTEAISHNRLECAYFTNRAAAYINLKKYNEAIKDSSTAKKINPKWIKTYFREGEAYFKL